LLHAALLGRGRPGAGEPLRRLCVVRRRPDPDQLPRDPALRAVHPPDDVHAQGPADGDLAVRDVHGRPRRADLARRRALPRGALREAARHPAPRASRGALVTTEEKYVAAAYLVVFLAVLIYVLIISSKLTRLERQVSELTELALRRKQEREADREEVGVGSAPLLACAAGLRRGGGRLRGERPAARLGRPARDLGRPARLAAPERAPRCAGCARRRLPVGHVGRLVEPLRLARRHRL